ncbi:MAG: hypothetical protein DMG06_17810 [Acidobacteria bacterium]|nr:MAG: hypothetical protein DMG06_17810 [Acidobacteriota bacterium]
MASFLTGIGGPGTWGEYEVPQFISSQNFQFAGFVQDNWKATDKLTLNLGLRYDLDLPRTERFNAMSYLDPDVASPLQVPGRVEAFNAFNHPQFCGPGRDRW